MSADEGVPVETDDGAPMSADTASIPVDELPLPPERLAALERALAALSPERREHALQAIGGALASEAIGAELDICLDQLSIASLRKLECIAGLAAALPAEPAAAPRAAASVQVEGPLPPAPSPRGPGRARPGTGPPVYFTGEPGSVTGQPPLKSGLHGLGRQQAMQAAAARSAAAQAGGRSGTPLPAASPDGTCEVKDAHDERLILQGDRHGAAQNFHDGGHSMMTAPKGPAALAHDAYEGFLHQNNYRPVLADCAGQHQHPADNSAASYNHGAQPNVPPSRMAAPLGAAAAAAGSASASYAFPAAPALLSSDSSDYFLQRRDAMANAYGRGANDRNGPFMGNGMHPNSSVVSQPAPPPHLRAAAQQHAQPPQVWVSAQQHTQLHLVACAAPTGSGNLAYAVQPPLPPLPFADYRTTGERRPADTYV